MNGRASSRIRRLGISASLSLCLMGAGPVAGAADQAWTRDVTSAGLQQQGVAVAVAFLPRADRSHRPSIPPGAVITKVYASRSYAGVAQVATELCQAPDHGPCVPLIGRSTTTHTFDGLPASGPLWLVHRVVQWGDAHAPIFVRGTVTVWFGTPRH